MSAEVVALSARLSLIPAAAEPPAGVIATAVDFAARGYHLDVATPPELVVAVAESLSQGGFALDTITGLDWPADGQMEVVYDYFHPANGLRVAVRTRVPRDQAAVASIMAVYPGAAWHERETHDFFGIVFPGNPDMSPLLLPEDADFHPLRKDYAG